MKCESDLRECEREYEGHSRLRTKDCSFQAMVYLHSTIDQPYMEWNVDLLHNTS